MYQLDTPIYFYLFIVIPLFIITHIFLIRWKIKTQKKFTSSSNLSVLSPYKSFFKFNLKFILFIICLSFIIFGLVNPKIGTELESVKREGVDIIFALDVSKSMLAEDIAPNRLEKAKRLVSAIIDDLVSDRIGIIAYAATAVPQLPITTDYGSAKMFLQSLNTNLLSSQGTAINEAINLGVNSFNLDEKTNKILVLISDGEDHNNFSNEFVLKAKKKGIKIFTFGVGYELGSPIPIKVNGVIQNYKKDNNNEVVITKRNSNFLMNISNESGGAYLDGNNTKNVTEFFKEKLKEIDKNEFEAKKFVSFKDRFQLFLLIALIVICIDFFVLETRTKWIKKMNLFNEN